MRAVLASSAQEKPSRCCCCSLLLVKMHDHSPTERSPPLSLRPLSLSDRRDRFPMASSSLAKAPGYVCDTIPPARIAHRPSSRSPSPLPPPTPPVTAFKAPITETVAHVDEPAAPAQEEERAPVISSIAPPPGRKLCVRHQRMADEGTILKLQQVSPSVPLSSASAPCSPSVGPAPVIGGGAPKRDGSSGPGVLRCVHGDILHYRGMFPPRVP